MTPIGHPPGFEISDPGEGWAPTLFTLVNSHTYPEPPALRYVVEGLLPESYPTWLFARGGSAKSYVALHMACCICLGYPWLGLETTQGPVLYLDAELEPDEHHRRAYRIARGLGWDRPPEGLHYIRLPGSLGYDQMVAELWQAHARVRPVLTVIDSISFAAAGLDLTGSGETTDLMKRALDPLGTKLVIDHVSKASSQGNQSEATAYGSVRKRDYARSSLQIIQAAAGGLLLNQEKHNFGALADHIFFSIDWTHAQRDTPYDQQFVRIHTVSAIDDRMGGIESNMKARDRVLYRLMLREGLEIHTDELAAELELSVSSVRNYLSELKKMRKATNADTSSGCWRATRPGERTDHPGPPAYEQPGLEGPP